MVELATNWTASERRHAANRRAFYLSAEYLVAAWCLTTCWPWAFWRKCASCFPKRALTSIPLRTWRTWLLGNGGLGRLAGLFPRQRRHARHPAGRLRAALQVRPFFARRLKTAARWRPRTTGRSGATPGACAATTLRVTVPMRTGEVVAVPYDMPVIGLGGHKHRHAAAVAGGERGRNSTSASSTSRSTRRLRRLKNRAEDITKVLYPNDTLRAGKQMRIKQQYMLVSSQFAGHPPAIRQIRQASGGIALPPSPCNSTTRIRPWPFPN